MLRSLYSGVTGLQASGTKMGVVGDNLANSQTIGFKKSIPIFQDLLSQSVGSVAGGSQLGLGANLGAIWQDFSQGAFRSTNRSLDIAINGTGFFKLQNRSVTGDVADYIGTADYYTRAGSFDLDQNGYVINPQGLILQGEVMNSTTGEIVSGVMTNIKVDATRVTPKQTSGIDLSLNLNPAASAHSTYEYYAFTSSVTSQGVEIHNDFTYYADTSGVATAAFGTQVVASDGGDLVFTITNGTTAETISMAVTSGDTMSDILGDLTTALAALTTYSGATATAVVSGADTVIRLLTNDEAVSFVFTTDPTSLGFDAGAIYSNASVGSVGFNFGTSAAFSTVNITVADNTTLASLAAQLDDALSDMYYSGRAVIVSNASGAYIRIDPSDTTWAVQPAGTFGDTTNGLNFQEQQPSATAQQFDAQDSDTWDYSNSIAIYDQQGQAHNIHFYYRKVDTNTWDYYILAPDSVTPNAYTTTPAQATGRLVFDEDGLIATQYDGTGNILTGGADNSVTFTFVDDETGTPVDLPISLDFTPGTTYGSTTQNGNQFVTYFVGQNGYGPGSLESLEVNREGYLVGQYSNGETLNVARIGLATFRSEQGLKRVGGTNWAWTQDSGEPTMNPASEGQSGTLLGNAVEDSNVDMAEEFIDMIVAQRAWQANAKTISTSDQMLAELMNIKR